jgi:LacI family transcriptional regulator
LIESGELPTAVFASDDLMAIGAMNAAFERGICIPQDLSVLGFDDISFSGFTNPPLSTIRQPTNEIGRAAMKIMLALVRGESPDPHVTIQPELVERKTCSYLHA